MNKLFVVIAVVSLVLATGCATTSSRVSQINVPSTDGKTPEAMQAIGDLNSVVKSTKTTTTTDATGTIVSVVTEVVEEQAARNNADADQELEMRREDRKEAIGVAKATNPAPVIVVPTRYSSVVTTGSRYHTGSSTHRGGGSRVRRPPSRRVDTSAGTNVVGGSKPKPRR